MSKLKYNHSTGQIIDSDDNQLVASMGDGATKEQCQALVDCYNNSTERAQTELHFDFLPQGPSCVNNLISISMKALNHLPLSLQTEMRDALTQFQECSVPVAWTFDEISKNLAKSKNIFIEDFPKEGGFTKKLTQPEYLEILEGMIARSKDDGAQEKVQDISTAVFDKRKNLQ